MTTQRVDHADLLRQAEIFAGLDRVTLARLAAHFETLQLRDGTVLCRQGDAGDALYVIGRGGFSVFVTAPDGSELKVATRGPGEAVGEMALLTGESRAATLAADGDSEVFRLDRAHFLGLIDREPSVALAIAASLARRLRARSVLREAPPRDISRVPAPFDMPPVGESSADVPRSVPNPRFGKRNRMIVGLCLAAVVVLAGYLIPPPSGLSDSGWHALVTLLGAVAVMLADALPEGAIGLILPGLWVVGGVTTPGVALGGFATETWILTVAIFVVGALITSSGLTFRVSLWAIEHVAGGFPRLLTSLLVAGVLSSMAIPNPSGRSLLIAPLTVDLAEAFDYAPGSEKAAGLGLAALVGFGQIAALFLTSSTTALLALTLLPQHARTSLTWNTWTVRAAPFYLILLVGMFGFIAWWYGSRMSPRAPRSRQAEAEVRLLQRSLLGPLSGKERIAGLVGIFLVVGFITEPVHHVDPSWIAVGAAGIMAATGSLTAQALQSISWSYILLFGTLTSTADVFAATGLNNWLAGVAAGLLAGPARIPILFVALLVLTCSGLNFVLRFEAAAPLLIIALAPMAVRVGVDPWVIAFIALVGTRSFLFPYQNSAYQALYYSTGGILFTHKQAMPGAIAYQALTLIAACASVPIWHTMGLL